jgi:hypothetical protein
LLTDISTEWLGSKFTVVVSNEFGCTSESDEYEMMTKVNEIEFDELVTINPNPSSGIFNITLNLQNELPFDVIVNNLLGEVIYNKQNIAQFGKSEISIDISNQPAGVYMLNIHSQGFTWTTKLIKR